MTTIFKPETRGTGYGDVIRAEVTAGQTTAVLTPSMDAIIVCKPGAGGSMRAEATWSPPSHIQADTAIWLPWDHGDVVTATSMMLNKATGVRFVALGADGIGEVSR